MDLTAMLFMAAKQRQELIKECDDAVVKLIDMDFSPDMVAYRYGVFHRKIKEMSLLIEYLKSLIEENEVKKK